MPEQEEAVQPMPLAVVTDNPIDRPRTAAEIRGGINLIQEVMRDCMKDKVHYGTVPGCGDKPTLLKAGAEKIMATFRLGAEPEITDCSDGVVVRYRIRVRGFTPSGLTVGWGVGEASSGEEKYCWRRAACDEEYNQTPETDRRLKWKSYNGKAECTQQVRCNPADIANTVLKMAKKRALVDLCLTAAGASDIFTQDIEDMPPEVLERGRAPAAPVSRPRATATPTPAAATPRAVTPPKAAIVPPAAQKPVAAPVAQANAPGAAQAFLKNAMAPEDGPQDAIEALPIDPDGVAVVNVSVRTGKSSRGEWKLFIIKTSDGNEYTTFDEAIADKLAAVTGTGALVGIDSISETVKMKNGTTAERKKITAVSGC